MNTDVFGFQNLKFKFKLIKIIRVYSCSSVDNFLHCFKLTETHVPPPIFDSIFIFAPILSARI